MGSEINLSKVTGKFMGRSYKELPCLQLIHSFYQEIGIELPNEYKDINLLNYLTLLAENKEKAFEILFEVMDTIGEENTGKLNKFDFLAIKEELNDNIYVGIYLYNDMVLVSNLNSGVRISHLGKYHTVIKARKMI